VSSTSRLVLFVLIGLFGLAGSANAVPMRLSFSGSWEPSLGGPLSPDLPFASGDQLTGFALFDAPAGVDSFASPISLFSLTFEGLGTITWNANLSSLSRKFATPENFAIVSSLTGSPRVRLRLRDQLTVNIPGVPGVGTTLNGTGWEGSPGIATFPYSDPEALQDWVMRTFESTIWFSELTPPSDPSGALSFRTFGLIYDTRSTQLSTTASTSGRVHSASLQQLPEPSTFVSLFVALCAVWILRRAQSDGSRPVRSRDDLG